MNLRALKGDFEGVMARFPSAPKFEPALDLARSIEEDVDIAFKRFQRTMIAWRSQLSMYLPEVENVFKNVKSNPEEIDFLLYVALPRVLSMVDDSIEVEEKNKISLVSLQKQLGEFVEISNKSEGLLRIIEEIEEFGVATCNAHVETLENLHDRLKAIEWDNDPDARGGEVFENADDLIASLRH